MDLELHLGMAEFPRLTLPIKLQMNFLTHVMCACKIHVSLHGWHKPRMTNATKSLFQQTMLVYHVSAEPMLLSLLKLLMHTPPCLELNAKVLIAGFTLWLWGDQGHNLGLLLRWTREWILVNTNANLMACKGTPRGKWHLLFMTVIKVGTRRMNISQ